MTRRILPPNDNAILDAKFSAALARHHFGKNLDAARELVEWAAGLLGRLFIREAKTVPDIVLIGALFRQVVATADATILALENGAVYGAQFPLRGLFENALYVEWFLSQGKERWGRQYYAAHLRRERAWTLRGIPGTPANEALSRVINEAFGHGVREFSPDEIRGLTNVVDEAEGLLHSETYREYNKYFDDYRARHPSKESDPAWHLPGPNGVESIRKMARKLGREADYVIVYDTLSAIIHGTRLRESARSDGAGTELQSVRSLDGFKMAFMLAAYTLVRICRLLIKHYRPSEWPQYQKTYVERWRSRLDPPDVELTVDRLTF